MLFEQNLINVANGSKKQFRTHKIHKGEAFFTLSTLRSTVDSYKSIDRRNKEENPSLNVVVETQRMIFWHQSYIAKFLNWVCNYS